MQIDQQLLPENHWLPYHMSRTLEAAKDDFSDDPLLRVAFQIYAGVGEASSFTPIQNELLQLAKYWATTLVEFDYHHFLHRKFEYHRFRRLAAARFETVRKSIGDEKANQAFTEAQQAFAKRVDQDTWNEFREWAQYDTVLWHGRLRTAEDY